MVVRRALAAAVAVLLTASAAYLTASTGRSAAADNPPLALSDYPVPDGAIFVATSGSDSAAGTRSAPKRTLAAALGKVRPGGTIVLRSGTYRESVGMVRKRVTIQPYPGERVWFKGSVLVDDWERTGDVWEHTGWHDDLCEDCYLPEIIDEDHPMAGRPEMVFVNGKPLRQVASRDEVRPGKFYAGDDLVVIGDDPSGRQVEVTRYDHLLQFDGPEAAGSRLLGVGVAQYGSNQNYGARGAMVVVNSRDVTVERATFAHSASTGLAVFQPGGRVSASILTSNGLVGLLANRADGLKVTGSRFTGNNAEHFTLGGDAVGAAGAKITHTRKPYVTGNRFSANHATGWWCDLGCTDATVVRNHASGNLRHGLYYEVSSRARISENTLAGNRGHGVKVSSADRVRLEDNTFTGNRSGSLGLYNDPRDPSSDPYSDSLGLSWVTEGLVIKGNRFDQRSARPVITSADHKPDPSGNPPFVATLDYDSYARPASSHPLVVLVTGDGRSTAYRDLAELRAAGFEQHGEAERLR